MKKLKIKKAWTAERIKALRLKYELTQEQIAGVIGITQQAYARMESGSHVLGRMSEIAWEKIEEHLSQSLKSSK